MLQEVKKLNAEVLDAEPVPSDENGAIVIDNGSYMITAGVVGYNAPSVEIRSVVGSPRWTADRRREASAGLHADLYFGDEAHFKQPFLRCKYPIEYGVITDWDAMEKVVKTCRAE